MIRFFKWLVGLIAGTVAEAQFRSDWKRWID